MKVFKRIITLLIIQIYVMTNICFAAQVMPEGLSEASATLSPQVMILNDVLKDSFILAADDNFTLMPDVFLEDDSELSFQGRFFVEFGIVFHELGNDLVSVVTALDLVDNKERDSLDENDLEKILQMSDVLYDINRQIIEIFNNDSIPSLKKVCDILIQADDLKEMYPELVALRDKGCLCKAYAGILDRGIKCIDFVVEHSDAVLFGVREEKFNIVDLFEKEQRYKILDTEGLLSAELFGYRSGLKFVIRNLRSNLLYHAGSLSQGYSVKIAQEDENIIIYFADRGVGFDIGKLKEKAVELGFWDQVRAETASDDEVIDLIFKKGFSRRYEEGTAHGLGLWLCREVLGKYFNASITAENAQGQTGAVFKITIPLNKTLGAVRDKLGESTKEESFSADRRRILDAFDGKQTQLKQHIKIEDQVLIEQAI